MNKKTINKIVNSYFVKKGLPVQTGLPLDRAVTFDDVFIQDETSRIEKRSQIDDLSTRLAGNLKINIPIVPANMADITESEMAIAIARLGGCGFIHQFMSLGRRAEEVQKVKRADNEIIENPWIINENDSFTSALDFMKDKKTSGLLVVDNYGKLSGILTSRDIRFIKYEHLKVGGKSQAGLKVKDVMTRAPLKTAPPNIKINETVRLLNKYKIEKLPLLDKTGKPVGLITAKDILKKMQFPKAVRDKKGRLIVGATVGIASDFLKEAESLIEAGADLILVDTARGNSLRMAKAVEKLRKRFKNFPIIAGNVDNAEGALLLIQAGASGVKVGIGPGSACKTRIATGVGVPQLTAIAECAAVAQKFGATIIADGGIKDGSDLAKALIAGADAVMIGGLFAVTEETPGEVFYDGGERFKLYRGSAGLDSQLNRIDKGELAGLRAPEGVSRKIPYKGQTAAEVVGTLLGNLRSTMSYANAMTILELHKKTFRLQSRAGYLEGQPRF